jgi:anti-sigma regulatory factor (Ser/Thr protein kinase)
MQSPVALTVVETSQVGESRRAATALAARLGFEEEDSSRMALLTTEVATNLVKHGREGLLLLRALRDGDATGIELLALDKGPGMADVARCLHDGYSTAGSSGTGLGAIKRLSDFLDIWSAPTGTALVTRLWTGRRRLPKSGSFSVAAVTVPMAGESVCGDAWAEEQAGGRVYFLVADGLGHGPDAAAAANTAVRLFRANTGQGPGEILSILHQGMRSTRGAAVAVAVVDLDAGVVHFAGVGNISGLVLAGDTSRSMVSHNGIVGHEARKFQSFSYPFPATATLVMHSDGLRSRWDLNAYRGLIARDPALIAGILYRDFQRGRDDVTVLVARAAGGSGA